MVTLATPSPPGRSPLHIGERELVIMLALTQALHALAIDAMLPGLGAIAGDLDVSDPNRRQLVVGVFLFGLGIGSLVPGALADRYGRRRLLLGCILGYIALSLASALATDFSALVAIRAVQGALTAGLAVIPGAIIRDRFDGDRMAKLQSLISVIFMVVPMLAPSLGQAILIVAGWRWIFGLMALYGLAMYLWVFLRLPETLDPANRQSLHPRIVAGNFGEVLANRESAGYVLASTFTLGVVWGYIQSSQQLIGEHFGAGTAFPLFFGGMALAMALSSLTNSRIVERFGARRVSHAALLCYLVISTLQVWMAHDDSETLWQFVPLMTLNMMMGSFMGANFGSIALQPFARIAGAAASVQAFVRLVAGSLIGAVVGQAYDGTARPLSWALLAAGLFALTLVLFSEKGRLFRRLNPPGATRPIAEL